MGFYHLAEPEPEFPKLRDRLRAHPVWYGLGCLLALLIPVMSFALAWWLVQLNQQYGWFAIPPQLIQREPLPLIGRVHPYTPLYAALTLLIALFLYGVLSLVYAVVYRLFGGSPYTPFDAID